MLVLGLGLGLVRGARHEVEALEEGVCEQEDGARGRDEVRVDVGQHLAKQSGAISRNQAQSAAISRRTRRRRGACSRAGAGQHLV